MDNSIDDAILARNRQKIAFERSKRELRRLKSSVSFRIGVHLTTSVRKPWMLLLLPFTFPLLIFKIGLERLGRVEHPVADVEESAILPRNSVVLFPTNGVGFGHFTRLYSVAKRLRRDDPELEIVIFTTMPTLHLPYTDGFVTYHLAGRHKNSQMEASTWNTLVDEMLSLVIDIHKPKEFIFDGAYPYRGMLNSIAGKKWLRKTWVRRGTFRKGSRIPVDSIQHFDLIIHPQDVVEIAQNDLEHEVDVLMVPPITLIDKAEMWDSSKVKRRFGIPLDSRVAYVQLGAGKINDIDSEISYVISALLEEENLYVVLGESMLGDRLDIDRDRVHVLRDYPNSIYLNGFDFSIQAGGYNSFHEMRKMAIPTLFLPNLNTGMDDQVTRCENAVSEGWGLVNLNRSREGIKQDISSLLSLDCSELHQEIGENGADVISSHLLSSKIIDVSP
jgi:UDP-N-acetylglucosamine--N-acetylmuramyl-(pentapeptide) pyrophosphoryl-undecaprenol N-acetylglucosamine transferase